MDSLIPIKGIGQPLEKKLIEEGIPNVTALLAKAGTHEERVALAAKLDVNEKFVYSWVKQGELLRVQGMTADAADLLVKVGVRDVEDLSRVNAEMALPLMKSISDTISPAIKLFPTKETLTDWKNKAITMRPIIIRDTDDPAPPVVLAPPAAREPDEADSQTALSTREDYYYDMGDVISSVGRGIAEAQQALDMSAIMTQQQINKDEDLLAWGLSAHWYTIPEATVNLKMSYQMSNERVEEGSVKAESAAVGAITKRRLMISPVNAKFTNTFKVNESLQSEVTLKFLPIPAPTRWTEQITVPDFSGMTLADAKESIRANGLKLGDVKLADEVTEADGVVVSQLPPADSRVWLADKVNILLGIPPKPVPEPVTEPDNEPDTEPDNEPDTESDKKPGSEPGIELKPASMLNNANILLGTRLAPEPEPKSKPELGLEPEPESKPKPMPKVKTSTKTKNTSKIKSKPKPKSKPKGDSGPEEGGK